MARDRDHLSVMMLSALEALYLTKKTTLAAEKLGIAQPSMSVYLKQLRELTGDALFIRTSHGLEPTDFCHTYYTRVKDILNSLDLLSAASNRDFDPAHMPAAFSVAASFVKGRMFFENLALGVIKKYPLQSVDMIFMPEAEALRDIDSGRVDIFIGMVSEKLEKHYSAARLQSTELVVLCSKNSPHFKKGSIGKADYLETPHIKAATSFEPSMLDAKFKKLGLLQKKLVSVPDVAAEISLLRETDYLLVIDQSDVGFIEGRAAFKVLKTDFELPQFDFHCVWHARKNDSPSHKWYRDYVTAVCGKDARKGSGGKRETQ